MTVNPEVFLTMLATTIALFMTLLFLPAIVELRKPKDLGPRLITNFSTKTPLSVQHWALFNMEEKSAFDAQLDEIQVLDGVIPDLE